MLSMENCKLNQVLGNINNFIGYWITLPLMEESEEELESLSKKEMKRLKKVTESANIQESVKIIASD